MTTDELTDWVLRQLHNAQVHADCMEAKAIALEAELAASQRRERAAVEDLLDLAKNKIECLICERYHDDSCTITEDNCCNFEWRGPGDEEKQK